MNSKSSLKSFCIGLLSTLLTIALPIWAHGQASENLAQINSMMKIQSPFYGAPFFKTHEDAELFLSAGLDETFIRELISIPSPKFPYFFAAGQLKRKVSEGALSLKTSSDKTELLSRLRAIGALPSFDGRPLLVGWMTECLQVEECNARRISSVQSTLKKYGFKWSETAFVSYFHFVHLKQLTDDDLLEYYLKTKDPWGNALISYLQVTAPRDFYKESNVDPATDEEVLATVVNDNEPHFLLYDRIVDYRAPDSLLSLIHGVETAGNPAFGPTSIKDLMSIILSYKYRVHLSPEQTIPLISAKDASGQFVFTPVKLVTFLNSGFGSSDIEVEEQIRTNGRPHAVIVYARSDWNGAFQTTGRQYFKLLSSAYSVSFEAVANKGEFCRALLKYDHIDLLVIGGHGQPEMIDLSDVADGANKTSTIFLKSCSTGGKTKDKSENLANFLYRISGAGKLFAAKDLLSENNIEVTSVLPFEVSIFGGLSVNADGGMPTAPRDSAHNITLRLSSDRP